MAGGFLPTRRSKCFFAVLLFGCVLFLLMAVRLFRSDRFFTKEYNSQTSISIPDQRAMQLLKQGEPNKVPAAPVVPQAVPAANRPAPAPQPIPKGGIWGQACPTWSPPASPQADPPLTAEREAEATQLTKTLRTRLELPNDIVMPNFNESCDVLALDKNRYLKACTDKKCAHPLSKNLDERVRDVLGSPEMQLTEEHRRAIDAFSQKFPENDVIIVTAASSNHFGEAQKMFKSLHEVVYPTLKNFSTVFIDIGLSAREKKLAENGCKCQMVQFPYEWFPPHVKVNNCYAFKPLSVLAAMQKARRLVVWMDSSVRWTSGYKHIFERAERYGSQIIRYEGMARVSAHTLRPTFDYMKRDVCAFTAFPEIEACAQVHLKDPVTLRLLLEPWARCGLERCCICPVSPGPVLPCTKNIALHRCHRFDQSAMTMLMARLLNDDFQKLVMPNWFENQPVLRKLGGDTMSNYFHL
ncbi:hypothetical protein RRG08_066319 [Elysia crispata]|uniref:Uncharacterized protein n=1 Tax=Elysia crispata TaxID=231223 RepID=A0AAE1E5E0_9GAST|nr:hypothetical protein RRG08_066319 [Elysia crispata]